MTTLTTTIVLLAVASLFASSYQIVFGSSIDGESSRSSETGPREVTDGEFNGCLISVVGIFLLSCTLGWAITTDLTGVSDFPIDRKYVLITSLVMIGVSSGLSLFMRWRRKGVGFENPISMNGTGLVGYIVWVISLLASILGILSFYFDYLE